MDIFVDTLIGYLGEIVGIVIVTLVGIFASWLLSKMKQKKGLENITIATEQVLLAVQDTVWELQQTLVEGWKRGQDGKLTEEQVAELQQKVIEITLAKLSEPTLKLLNGAKTDVIALIRSAAEGCVLKLKEN